MIFVGFTIMRLKYANEEKERSFSPNGIKVRYKIENISHYQEYSSTESIVYIKGAKLWVKETVEELDMIFNGANDKTVGLLYGKT